MNRVLKKDISLSPTVRADFDEFRKVLVEQGEQPEAVTGVVERAELLVDRRADERYGLIPVRC